MNPVREKIKKKLDELESALKSQNHLDADKIEGVLNLMESCSKYWRVLDDAERDFLNAARDAFKERKRWA
ncbi:hypothetical protein [Nioella nitratireducens]|uniref:hypothetical protein n=1 Tax=Nioella nitratireducens TaxID=1287720 RepID=UPI0008FD8654|nr:hypothetical protein [Nioella nitratireducens]